MSKTKLLSIAVILLLLINLTTLFLIFTRPPKPEHHQEPKQVIIEKLDLDNKQVKEFEVLIEEHKKKINREDVKLRRLKKEIYKTLSTDEFSLKDSLINELSIVQRSIENIHYEHFKALKKLCKPEQIEKFNDLTEELARLFSPANKKPNRPRD